jgi:hypothetical protein
VSLFYIVSIFLMLKAANAVALTRRRAAPRRARLRPMRRLSSDRPGHAERRVLYTWNTPHLLDGAARVLLNCTAFPLTNHLMPVVAKISPFRQTTATRLRPSRPGPDRLPPAQPSPTGFRRRA